MRTTKGLAQILSYRLDQPEAFEVRASTIGGRHFQAPITAVHPDCFEYSDGTLVPFQNITDLRILDV